MNTRGPAGSSTHGALRLETSRQARNHRLGIAVSTCTDNTRLGRIGCGATYGGELQHSVAAVPWSAHLDGFAHVTASLSVIDHCWNKGKGQMADPATLGLEQDDGGRWRRPMTDEQRSRLAQIRQERLTAVDFSLADGPA